MRCCTMRESEVLGEVKCGAVQCESGRCCAVKWSAVLYSVRCCSVECSESGFTQCEKVLCSEVQCERCCTVRECQVPL